MMTTLRPLPGITKDDEKDIPASYKLYDFTQGGTDIVDQLNDFYSTRSQSLRWVNVALFYTLDTARVNAKTLYCLAQGKHPRSYDSFKFGWDLMLSLVRPFAELRSRNGLQHPIQVKMDILLGNDRGGRS